MNNERHERRRVTDAIKLALAKIAEQNPELAQLLRESIKTGTVLSYTPVASPPAPRRKRPSEAEKEARKSHKNPIRH
jgi:hypothetical protein